LVVRFFSWLKPFAARYAGRDATRVFDIYGHSGWAHAFMRRHLLVFDAPAFVGRIGAPLCKPVV
jgi:hypothetical protein